jgi:two-component system cell cycle response regulator
MTEGSSIIIVDDDVILLTMLKENLVREGYRCETADSAETALELVRGSSFDIMLTDITLPGMKGFELTERAKNLRPDMAVIIMTGFVDDFSYDSAIEAGASDFIKKPFTIKELRARMEHVRVHEKQRVMAMTDELTGLCNRWGFFTLVEQQIRLSKRLNKGMYILYVDVDNLKMINDTLGHRIGDTALVDAADILKKTYRESDIIARIGGDEFVVAPIGTTEDKIEAVTARLEENIKRHNAKESRPYELSLSYGVAYCGPESVCNIDGLLAEAEKLMYEHKNMKRKSGPETTQP